MWTIEWYYPSISEWREITEDRTRFRWLALRRFARRAFNPISVAEWRLLYNGEVRYSVHQHREMV